MAKAPAKTIDPDRMYRITFSSAFEAEDGTKYIPRNDVRHTVRGDVLEKIKGNVDTYEAL